MSLILECGLPTQNVFSAPISWSLLRSIYLSLSIYIYAIAVVNQQTCSSITHPRSSITIGFQYGLVAFKAEKLQKHIVQLMHVTVI